MPRGAQAKRCGTCKNCQNLHWKKQCTGSLLALPPPTPSSTSASDPSVAAPREVERRKTDPSHQEQVSRQSDALASDAVVRLAGLFDVSTDKIHAIRRKDDFFSLVDIAGLVCGKDANYAAQQLRVICGKYSDINGKAIDIKFPGRAQKLTPCGDIYLVVALVMLLPGRRAASVRSEAARALVHIFGGSLQLANQIIANRSVQDNLRAEDPEAAARVFGDVVERESGDMDHDLVAFEQSLLEYTRKRTNYDPQKLTEVHHNHKDKANRMLIEGAERYFDGIQRMVAAGHVIVLDDFDANGVPRSCGALIRSGVPPSAILSPNKEPVVATALAKLGVQSATRHINHAIEREFAGKNVVLAYLDTCTGDVAEMEMMIDRVKDANRSGGMILAYTLITRSFTEGGASPFTRRIVHLIQYMQGWGFKPMNGTLPASYLEYHDAKQRVGTAFWMKPRSYS